MSKTLEFFFDVGSPTTYLAWTQIREVVDRCGAELQYRPFLLGGVFKATGNASPVLVEAKRKYLFRDIERFARRYDVPFRLNPGFPFNTIPLMRGAIAAQREGRIDAYLDALFPAIWEHEKDVGDTDILAIVLADAGFNMGWYSAATQDQDVKQALIANTSEAVERGAFGAPTFFVGDEMFFGQDRLDFVAECIA